MGAGTGTVCYGLKGGIGSASRVMRIGGVNYTLGVLVQSNFGATEDLVIDGIRPANGFWRKRKGAGRWPPQNRTRGPS